MGRSFNLLVTGSPGSGKTTLIEKVAERLVGRMKVGGFFTGEIRDAGGGRTGFKIASLDGGEGVLARKGPGSGPRVGSYRVNLADLERVGVRAINEALEGADVILLDEIGKMELFSSPFREAVLQALDSPKPLIATITAARIPFVDQVKQRKDCILLHLRNENRDTLADEILRFLEGEARSSVP